MNYLCVSPNEFFAHALHMCSYVCLLQQTMMMLSTLEMQIYDYKNFLRVVHHLIINPLKIHEKKIPNAFYRIKTNSVLFENMIEMNIYRFFYILEVYYTY